MKINGLLMAYEYGSTAEKSQARQILGILKLKEADIFKTQGSGETASHIRLKGAEDLIESRIKTW